MLAQKLSFLLIMVSLLFFQCKQKKASYPDLPVYDYQKATFSDSASVVSAHPEASKIGIDILKKGGNAVDAAVAVQFALAVCYPVAGNIGGGGFMVYRDSDGHFSTLDYREKAPAASTSDMYLDSEGNADSELSRYGHLAAGVPGSVEGMWQAYSKYSKLKDWKMLVQPSVDLARKGFKLTDKQAINLNKNIDNFNKHSTRITPFTAKSHFTKGELFVQEDLAKVFEEIRDKGPAGFYDGWVADSIVAEMKRGNGIMTLEDLKNYDAVWREPITSQYKNYKIVGMPPPSSGGIALAQLLGIVDQFPMESLGFHSVPSVHRMIEAERRVFADRAKYLGDPDYYNVPVDQLLDKNYIKTRAESIDLEHASISDDIAAGQIKESEQTTHFCIVDQDRNAVSITTTINGGYGNKVIVGGAGFLLNNEMDDFSAKPGEPNLYGLIGAEANKIEPGKRMLSSMTPTIVEENDELRFVVGTPGGSTIITSVFQTILNRLTFGKTTAESVHLPRFHHQWKPDKVFVEDGCFDAKTTAELEAMGHDLEDRGKIGRVEAIYINKRNALESAADTRGDDHVESY